MTDFQFNRRAFLASVGGTALAYALDALGLSLAPWTVLASVLTVGGFTASRETARISASTISAMKVAPPSSRPALMICTQVVATMPPKAT